MSIRDEFIKDSKEILSDFGRDVIIYDIKFFPKNGDGSVVVAELEKAVSGRGPNSKYAIKTKCQVGEPVLTEELMVGGVRRKLMFDIKIPIESVTVDVRKLLQEGCSVHLDFAIGGVEHINWLRVFSVTERGHSAWVTLRVENIR